MVAILKTQVNADCTLSQLECDCDIAVYLPKRSFEIACVNNAFGVF